MSTHLTESEFDNILMDQSKQLFVIYYEAVHTVGNGEQLRTFEVAIPRLTLMLQILQFNCRLWNEGSYGYKAHEFIHRIEVACRNTRDELHHAAKAKRSQLDKLIAKCWELEKCFGYVRGDEPTGTPSSIVEQVCGLESGVDKGPICHDDYAMSSMARQIASVESDHRPYGDH